MNTISRATSALAALNVGVLLLAACGGSVRDDATGSTSEALKFPPVAPIPTVIHPIPIEPAPAPPDPSCRDVVESWSSVVPPCNGPTDPSTVTSPIGKLGLGLILECNDEWALWSQLQAAGCSAPRGVAYVPPSPSIASGAYYAWCPPGDYPGTQSQTPQGCPVSGALENSQLVVWTPYLPGVVPQGCDLAECFRSGGSGDDDGSGSGGIQLQ